MASLGYVTIGALDGKKSGAFYDALFAALGSERKFESGGWIGYGVCPPFDGKEARAGNGIMIAYHGSSPEAVKAAYDAGMKNGGKDEGPPGFRPPDANKGFYGAYLRDPTGNKLCLFCTV
jgi:catechol 2,3-dioxygenase-like lactoylglutathione lyase family enzyme